MIEPAPQTKFTPTRIPLTADEPTTLPEMYERVVRDYPKPDTLNYKRDGAWHSLSAAEMLGRAKDIALGLHSRGVRKGDRVAIVAESCVEWVLADQGCLYMGAVIVPIYPTLTPPQVQYILEDCAPKVLFVETPVKFHKICDVVQSCQSISDTVLFHSVLARESRLLTLAQLEERGRDLASTKTQSHD